MKSKKIHVACLKIVIFILSFTFILTGISPALAEDGKPKVSLKTVAEKEIFSGTGENRIITTVPAADTASGDVIRYTIHYKNEGATDAVDAFVVDPVPAGCCYIDGTATAGPASLSFSLDSGNTFSPPPVMLKRKDASGKVEEVPAPPQSITHIKWTFDKGLKPGQGGILGFKVKVL